jgi:sugar phosphate permease
MSTVRFIQTHARLLGFGFLASFGASFGQTYFIALFNEPLRGAFNLSQGEFGTVYSLATFTSAGLMLHIGAQIDRVPLRQYTFFVAGGLGAVCVYLALVPTTSVLFLYGAILGLRFFGQGLLSHVSVVAMARSFNAARGRAVAIASMGHPFGEAILPITAVALMGVIGWRTSWGLFALGLIVIVLPALLWLARGEKNAEVSSSTDQNQQNEGRGFSRRHVLRDVRFYLMLPAILAPGFINTGIFFAQVPIIQEKGWTLELFAGGFAAYAAATVIGAILGGQLVDRLTAVRLYPFMLLPLATSMVWLGGSNASITVFGFMAVSGFGNGALSAVSGSLWAEIYGTKHLGAIRSLVVSLMVLSTSLSPALMGWAIEGGVSVDVLAFAFAVYAFLAAVLVTGTWALPLPVLDRKDTPR